MQITRKQVRAVAEAMSNLILERNKINAMISAERIEKQMYDMGVDFFVPTLIVLDVLIKEKRVRYFKLDSGKLLYGFTQQQQNAMFKPIQRSAV